MSRQVLTYPDMPPVLTQSAGDLRYLPLTGGSLSGGLNISLPAGEASLTISAPDDQWKLVRYSRAGDGVLRFIVGSSPTQNNYELHVYDDAGAYVGRAFSVVRSSKQMVFDAQAQLDWGFQVAEGGSNKWRHTIEGNQWVVRNPSGGNMLVMGPAGDTSVAGSVTAAGNFYANAGRLQASQSPGSANNITIDWNGYISSWNGQNLVLNPSGAYVVPVNNTVRLGSDTLPFNDITSSASLRLIGAAGWITATNNIQLSPGGTYVHPDGDNNRNMGHPGLRWANVYAAQVVATNYTAPGQINMNSGPGGPIVLSSVAANHWIYIRSVGHVFFDGSTGAIVAPEADNKLICGGTGNRWQYVAAVNGGINTCFEHEKAIVGEIQPDDALDAINKTPFFLYHPKDFEGNVDESLTFAGPVNTSVDARLQIGEGALTAAGHQAAYACAAIKALTARIEALEAARV